MFYYFLSTLIITLAITRVASHSLHFKKKTLTHLLRRKTSIDLHHIHLGFLLFIISIIYLWLLGKTILFAIFFGISLSLISDQIIPYIGLFDYFEFKGIVSSLILHILSAFLVYLFLF